MTKKVRAARLAVVDNVLVKILAHEGKHKLADKFGGDIYVVMKQRNTDIPVFEVRSQNGRTRTLHRNHLLPVGGTSVVKPVPAPRKVRLSEREEEGSVLEPTQIVTEETVKDPVSLPTQNQDGVMEQKDNVGIEDGDDSGEEYVDVTYFPGTIGDAQVLTRP